MQILRKLPLYNLDTFMFNDARSGSSTKLKVNSVTYVTSFFELTMKLMIKTIDTSIDEFFAVLAWINLYFDLIVLFIIHSMPSFIMPFHVFAFHHLFPN